MRRGHNAVVHGCEIGDDCLIGMGATILNGAKIGDGSIVAAGAVIPEGREFPPRSLIVGLPAKRVSDVGEEQAADIGRGATEYVERSQRTSSHCNTALDTPHSRRFSKKDEPLGGGRLSESQVSGFSKNNPMPDAFTHLGFTTSEGFSKQNELRDG